MGGWQRDGRDTEYWGSHKRAEVNNPKDKHGCVDAGQQGKWKHRYGKMETSVAET